MGRSNKIVPQSMCNWLLLLVFVLQFVVSLCVKEIWQIFSSKPLEQYNYILIAEIFAVGMPTVLLCLYYKSDFVKTFAVKPMRFSQVWRCVGLGLCLQPIAVVGNLIWQKVVGVTPSLSYGTTPYDIKSFVIGFIFTCVVPSICEEFLLRGVYLTAVKRKGHMFSIITSTVMFVLLHSDPSSLVAHSILGALTTVAVLNTNSVFAGILVHLSFNLGGILMDFATDEFLKAGFWFYFVLAGFCFVLSRVLLRSICSKKTKKTASGNIAPELFRAFFNFPVLIIILIYVYRIVG